MRKNKKQYECKIVEYLRPQLNASFQVPCSLGRIDILTDQSLVEIKSYANYFTAIGQVLLYNQEMKRENMIIIFFDQDSYFTSDLQRESKLNKIKEACLPLGIQVLDFIFDRKEILELK